MLLDLSNPFTFDLKDTYGKTTTFNGTFREFTKQEKINFDKKNNKIAKDMELMQSMIKKIQRNAKAISLKEKQELWVDVESLNEANDTLEDELTELSKKLDEDNAQGKVLRERFETCLGGEDRVEIIELAELHGYDRVFETIKEAISEQQSGK